jgi:SHS2 domain-containing protein
MRQQLQQGELSGTLPILYVFIARSGNTIKDVSLVNLDKDGNVTPVYQVRARQAVDGVKIEKKPEGFGLQASFSGDQGSHKYEIFGSVKAVTYNEMKIRQDDYVTIQVVVDM